MRNQINNIKNTVIVMSLLMVTLVAAIGANQRIVHIETISSDSFCMYMDSYKSKDLGLLACFKGTPTDVNEADEDLTQRMLTVKPLIASK